MTAEGRFLMLPVDIASRADLTATAKVVFCCIADRVGANGESWPGMRRLAKDCGCGLNAVKAAIASLESAGLIAVERQTGNPAGKTNRYRVHETCLKPTRSANQHVAQSACATCPKAPARRSAKRYITRPIEPDPLNQKEPPPTPPVDDVLFEDIIGPSAPPGLEPHGLTPGRTESPETNEAIPDAVLAALIAYIGSPTRIGGKLRSNIERYVGQYGEPLVLEVLAEAKATGRRWGDLGYMLNQRKQKEYDRGKPGDDSPARIRSGSGRYDQVDIVVD